MQEEKISCRVAPSIGELEDTFEHAWGLKTYSESDINKPAVFVGVYGLPDFYALWRHKGKKWIFWCGSDIRHLQNGYWLDGSGSILIDPKAFAQWINIYCESWVENYVECEALAELGIEANICPSFLGKINNFKVSYEYSKKPKLYTSVSGDDFGLYGWNLIADLAQNNQDIEFHLYGNKTKFPVVIFPNNNVIEHGQVPKEQMNEEIKKMQGALRLTEFDGFSEIIAKSVLMGQWPISLIKYPYTLGVNEIRKILEKNAPNLEGRNYYVNKLNKFPWTKRK